MFLSGDLAEVKSIDGNTAVVDIFPAGWIKTVTFPKEAADKVKVGQIYGISSDYKQLAVTPD